MVHRFIFLFFILTAFVSCSSDQNNSATEAEIIVKKNTSIKYAKGFEIEEKEDFKIVTLKDVWKGENTSHQYILYKNKQPLGYENATFIKVPINKIACMSVTHVALLEKLDQLNSVIALSGGAFVSSPTIKENIKNGKIKEVGNYQSLNYEMLVDEAPDLVMLFGIDQSSSSTINKLKELGLNVVLNAEYMELHPLGKLEWIKFMAAFYDMDKDANRIFDEIEKEYLALTNLTKDIKQKPTVFVGMPWSGSWYVPGGRSFVARLLEDAGANYLWANNDERSSFVKSKEVILDEALETDFWINLNSFSSIEDVIGYDEKFKNFSALKKQNLFNNNKRLNINEGNDYFESGGVNPHIVLKDLIEIFHPELLDHKLYYYQRLK